MDTENLESRMHESGARVARGEDTCLFGLTFNALNDIKFQYSLSPRLRLPIKNVKH